MLDYTSEFIADRTDHPLFISLLIMAAIFVVGGYYVESTGNDIWGAFLVIFAMMFAIIGLLGYVLSFLAKIIASYRERGSPV